jgi:excisionase family DNA binding protein
MSTEWLSVEKISQELDVKIEMVRRWIRQKHLTAYKVGNTYRVKREDLEKFLEERKTRRDE